VINKDGGPIQGFYAAGEVTAVFMEPTVWVEISISETDNLRRIGRRKRGQNQQNKTRAKANDFN